jgi:RES domain
MGSPVHAVSAEGPRRAALSRTFDRLHGKAVLEFRDFLIDHPMLGLDHPFGRELAKAIDRAKKFNVQPARWYHASLELSELRLQPRIRAKAINAHRFSQIGQIAWYLGCDERTVAAEVLGEPRSHVPFAVTQIEILEPVKVLDLRIPFEDENPTGSVILHEVIARRFVSEPRDDADESRPQYRVPQFVADLARRRGLHGILYDSTRPSAYNNPEAWGHNLVLFDPIPTCNPGRTEIMEFGEADFQFFAMERWPLRPLWSPL